MSVASSDGGTDMPTRYLRPGIRDSEKIDSLSPLAEVFYYRLLVSVDDFGRYDARPSMLKAECFPVKDSVTKESCQEMLVELVSSGLVIVYEHSGKPYLQLHKWENKARSKVSKYPQFDDDCIQLYADVSGSPTDENIPPTNLPGTGTGTGTGTVNRHRRDDDTSAELFQKFWAEYPRKVAKPDARKAFDKLKVDDGLLQAILAGLKRAKSSRDWVKDDGEFIPHPATWLNRAGWEDEYIPFVGNPGMAKDGFFDPTETTYRPAEEVWA